jgi:spermidine synthase
VGVKNSTYLAALINIAIAVTVLSLDYFIKFPVSGRAEEIVEKSHTRSKRPVDPLLRLALIGFLISGFAALAYEVLWTRVLVFLFSSSTYAFSIMLISFLVGIAVGSFIAARFADKIKDLVLSFGIVEIAIGFCGLFSVVLLGNSLPINRLLEKLIRIESWWSWNLIRFTESFLIMLIPTLLMGATFPIIVKIYTRSLKTLGLNVGTIYSFNTVGGVIGSFVAGFMLIPVVGTQASIYIIAFINIFLGIIFLFNSPFIKRHNRIMVSGSLIAIFLILVFLIIPKRIFYDAYNIVEQGSEIIFCDEGVTGTVTVHQYPDHKVISVNGVNVAGTSFLLRTTQKLQGHIPLLLHPNPKQVLQIGFGTGETSRVVLSYGIAKLDAVELCSNVMRANEYFIEINDNVYHKPGFNPIIMDGKNYVLLTDKKYDVIMNDSIHPCAMSNSSLYSVDYFKSCRERLKDDGIISSWFPLFGLKDEDFRTLIKSFVTVFPHSTLWIGNNCLNRHAQLVGWKKDEKFKIDFEVLKKRFEFPITQQDLKDIHIHNIFDFLDCFVADEEALSDFTRKAALNTDEYPVLEFSAPKTIGDDFIIWANNLENILQYRASAFSLLDNIKPEADIKQIKEKFDTYFKGSNHVWQGQLWELKQNSHRAQQAYEMAGKINPDETDAYYLLYSLLSRTERYEDRITDGIKNIDDYNKLGLLYLSEGKIDEAIIVLSDALKLDRKNSVINSNLGLAYLDKKEYDSAIEYFNRAISFNSKNIEAHYNLGLAYIIGKNQPEKAIEQWEKSLEIDPEYVGALYNLGLAYFNNKQFENAVNFLEKTIESQPQNQRAKKLLEKALQKIKSQNRE